MLPDIDAQPIVAVSDLDRAREFYGDVLGLEQIDEGGETATFRTGVTRLTVYRSDYAGTNRANAVVWAFDDGLEQEVQRLRGEDVSFEHYEMPDTTFSDGVHRSGDMRMAWFKDPDGNILHFVQGM